MKEIAIISTREVIYESSLQKSGKIKVTLKISQNLGSWNLDVKYFGVKKVTKIVDVPIQIGTNEETGEPIYGTGQEEQSYDEATLLKEKSLVKSDQVINGLFQAINMSIAPNEFPQKFYEIQRQALLMYVKNDLIDGENCIFGLKPNEWEIYKEN